MLKKVIGLSEGKKCIVRYDNSGFDCGSGSLTQKEYKGSTGAMWKRGPRMPILVEYPIRKECTITSDKRRTLSSSLDRAIVGYTPGSTPVAVS